MKSKYKKIAFILLLTIISSIPVFFHNQAIVQGHDLNFHLKRILGVVDNINILKSNPIYYNYLNHFGYGNGLFYPDIFLYIPALIYKMGLSIIDSYKIFIILINFFSILSIRTCIKKITKNDKSTKIGMILYAISSYRFTDMYLRAAIGENLAFIFLPLVILGLYKIFYENHKEGYYLSIGLIGLMLSHVITTYLIIYIIIVFSIINYKCLKDKKRLKELIIHIVFSMLITSFFWMPMIEQMLIDKFNFNANIEIFENCVPLPFLLLDIQIELPNRWIPSGIGLIYFIIIPLFIKTKEKNKFINSICIIGISAILLSSIKILWKIPLLYKLLSIIQFPWRLYSLATICFIIVTCYILDKIKKMEKPILIYTISIFIINCIITLFFPTIGNNLNENSIMIGEYLPIELKNNYQEVIKEYKNKNIEYKYEKDKLIVNIIKKTENIELPLIYYKGYKVESNNTNLKINKSSKGLVNVKIDDNIEKMIIYYEKTKINKIGNNISLLSLLIFCIYVKKTEQNNK